MRACVRPYQARLFVTLSLCHLFCGCKRVVKVNDLRTAKSCDEILPVVFQFSLKD